MKINAEQYKQIIANFQAATSARKEYADLIGEWVGGLGSRLAVIQLEQAYEKERGNNMSEELFKRLAAIEQGQAISCEALNELRECLSARNEMLDGMVRDMKLIFEMLAVVPSMAKVEGLQKNLNARADKLEQKLNAIQVYVAQRGKPKPRRKRP